MSWEDRDYADDNPMRGLGKPGGDWGGMRPSFDNPLTWSFHIFTFSRIAVRIHVFFLIFIVIRLGQSLSWDIGAVASSPLITTAAMLAILFTIVLLHEFGHCFACRRVGGSADEILMWPLGGLAFCAPPQRWKAHLVTAAGGPMVNVLICIVLGAVLGVVTKDWIGAAVPDLFDGQYGLAYLHLPGNSLIVQLAFMTQWLSLMLLLFNLLPIFPLDGGRIVQAIAWSKLGYVRSMRVAVRTGYIGAIALFIFGAINRNFFMCGIAIFGAIACYITHKQLEFTQQMVGVESDEYALGLNQDYGETPTPPHEPSRRERNRAAKIAERDQYAAAELDRILAKIRDSGMDSLTGQEKRLLKGETRRKRQDH